MTEPQAGSAVTQIATRATPADGGYHIAGTKIFSTNSVDAELFLVYVRFGPGLAGIGSVLLERGTHGFSIGQPSLFIKIGRASGRERVCPYLNISVCPVPL